IGTVGIAGVGGSVGDGDGWGIVSSTFPGVPGGIVTPGGGVDCANTASGVMLMQENNIKKSFGNRR
ncbi:MAG: hypothetical protein ACYT04_97955, partial [Nostoc sp.]